MALKKKQREQKDAEVPLSSMIDIIFLLIIFFVVTASLDKEVQDEQVKLANSPHGKPVEKIEKSAFTINVRGNGDVNVDGSVYKSTNFKTAVDQRLKGHVRKVGTTFPIILRCDENVKHGYIMKVQEVITDNRLATVRFNAELKGN